MTEKETALIEDQSRKISWSHEINLLRGATFVTLDDAISTLIQLVLEHHELNRDDIETHRFLCMLINNDERILREIIERVDIRQL